jgi:hypothetical protein
VLAQGTQNYHAMQASFARRYKNGLTFNANYTWAHGLGTALNGSYSSAYMGALARNQHYDYGNSDIDIRQRVAVTFNYELPFGKSLQGVAGTIVKGWQANAVTFWQTGSSFTVGNSKTNSNGLAQINLPNITTDRPSIVAGQSLYASNQNLSQWFNLAAITPQPAGTAGTAGRNMFYGPSTREADLSFFKTFVVREGIKLQFRAECYNISNTPNFANPNSVITGWARNGVALASSTQIQPGDSPTNAGGFGTISSTRLGSTPRQFQFALKILF